MKDSDDSYENWMKELEIEWEKWVEKGKELEVKDCDLINRCLFVSLVGLGKLNTENYQNYLKAVNYYS